MRSAVTLLNLIFMRYIEIVSLFLLLTFIAAGNVSAQDDGSLRVRGVIENLGMEDVRTANSLNRLDFYSSCGFNTYFYAPSDDVSRSSKGWKFLYPDREKKTLLDLMTACGERGMEFVWTIDPGNTYNWNDQDYELLKNKLVVMYHVGVRSFAMAFSGVEAVLSRMQQLKQRLMTEFVAQRREPVSLVLMDDYTIVDYPPFGADPKTLIQGIVLDQKSRADAVRSSSIVFKMRERSELSKLSVISIADFASAPDGYDEYASREKAIGMLAPEVKDAYLTFIRHSSGEDESEGVDTFTLTEYSKEKSDALMEEFRRIASVPGIMEKCASKELLVELKPWLTEFGKLGKRGIKVLECLQHYIDGDLGSFWIAYIDNLMSEGDVEAYNAHKSGSVKLQPFYESITSDLIDAFTRKMTGDGGIVRAGKASADVSAALDADFATSIHVNGRAVFTIPAKASHCHVLTGPLPSDGMVFLRQLASDGSLVAEFVVGSPYMSMELKKGAVKVDILGNVDVFETIFVSL